MQLLIDREKTHGDYAVTANVAQKLKAMIRNSPAYPNMTQKQCESLDMIAVKLARIMSGDPHEPDHWTDLAGYALLAIKERDDG